MKKTLAILLVLVLAIVPLAACGGSPSSAAPASTAPASAASAAAEPASEAPAAPEDGLKAAMLLPGPVSDVGWSGPAYKGLERLRDELGYEISYSEQVAAADYENVFRTYAQQGYDIIFAHGSQFYETAAKVAEEFPDTWFAVTSANETNGKNICGLNLSSRDVGFLVGALMGQMTESNQLGSVAGSEIPPLMGIVEGTEVGAKYVNPDAVVHNVYIGDADAAAAKEAALALINQGCDILTTCADVGSIGAINAATEKGLYLVATAQDFAPQAPQTVLASVMTDVTATVFAIGEKLVNNDLLPEVYRFGIKEDAVLMTGYGELEDAVPDEVKARMEEIIADVHSGKLVVADLFA